MRRNLGRARWLRSEVKQTIGFCRLPTWAFGPRKRMKNYASLGASHGFWGDFSTLSSGAPLPRRDRRQRPIVCPTRPVPPIPRQAGQLIFRSARKTPDNIRSSESRLGFCSHCPARPLCVGDMTAVIWTHNALMSLEDLGRRGTGGRLRERRDYPEPY